MPAVQITRRWSIRPVEAPDGKIVTGHITPQASKLTRFDTVRRRKAVRRTYANGAVHEEVE